MNSRTNSVLRRGLIRISRPVLAIGAVVLFVFVTLLGSTQLVSVARSAAFALGLNPSETLLAPTDGAPRVSVSGGQIEHRVSGNADPSNKIPAVDELILKAPTLAIDLPDVQERVPPKAKGGWPDVIGKAAKTLAGVNFGRLILQNATVQIRSHGKVRLVLEDFNGAVTMVSGRTSRLEASFKFLEERHEMSLSFGRGARSDGHALVPATLRLSSVKWSARFDGKLRFGPALRAEGALRLNIPDCRELLAWIGHSNNLIPMETRFQASGPFNWSQETLAIDGARLNFGTNKARGSLTMALGARPKFEGTLDFDKLVLTDLLQSESELSTQRSSNIEGLLQKLAYPQGQETSNADVSGSTFPSTPLYAWPSLHAVDLDLRLSAKRAEMAWLELSDAALTITLHNGRLFSDIAGARLSRGSLRGQLTAHVPAYGAPRLSARANFDGVELQSIVPPSLRSQTVRGKGSLGFDLKASGSTLDEWKKTARGKVELKMPDGGEVPIDLSLVVKNLESSQAKRLEMKQLQGASSIKHFNVDLLLKDGTASANNLELKWNDQTIKGTGQIVLPGERLSLDLSLANDSQSAKAKPLGRRLTVSGPLTAPEIELN